MPQPSTEIVPPVTVPITDKNYAKLAKPFIAAEQNFMLALRDMTVQGYEMSRSLKQYGAWLAFFRKNKIKQPQMRNWDHWMVPTEWPHQFATSATVAEDFRAGHWFKTKWLNAPGHLKGLQPIHRLRWIERHVE